MLCMAIEHYKQSQAVTDALEVINLIFVTIFTLEAAVKIFGLRWHFFRRAWNVFDFIIVVLSIVGKEPKKKTSFIIILIFFPSLLINY